MVPNKADGSGLLISGRVIGSTDGQPWLVLSSIITKDGVSYRLADLTGEYIPTPPHFDPVSLRAARFASMLHLAFDKNIDIAVKAFIRQAELPVDQGMNWGKYLYQIMVKKLPTKDDEVIDEVLRNVVYRELGDRRKLDPENPSGFKAKIKDFKWGEGQTKELPLDKQVTEFIKQSFLFRIKEAYALTRRLMGMRGRVGEETAEDFLSLTTPTGEEEGGRGLLDTAEHSTGLGDFERVESDIEIGDYSGRMKNTRMGKFSRGLFEFLLKKEDLPIARQYMRLLTLMHEEVKSYGKMPKLKDIRNEWIKRQNHDEASRNRLDNEGFKKVFLGLPVYMEAYVRTHYHGQETTLPAIVRVLNKFGQDKRQQQLENSQKDRDERKAEREEPTDEAALHGTPPGKLSAQGKQWEPPKCSGCGTGREARKCPGCDGVFCPLCVKDHHANFPGHDGV